MDLVVCLESDISKTLFSKKIVAPMFFEIEKAYDYGTERRVAAEIGKHGGRWENKIISGRNYYFSAYHQKV